MAFCNYLESVGGKPFCLKKNIPLVDVGQGIKIKSCGERANDDCSLGGRAEKPNTFIPVANIPTINRTGIPAASS